MSYECQTVGKSFQFRCAGGVINVKNRNTIMKLKKQYKKCLYSYVCLYVCVCLYSGENGWRLWSKWNYAATLDWMKLLCSCLSEQSANTHTHIDTHTHAHIQWHTHAHCQLPSLWYLQLYLNAHNNNNLTLTRCLRKQRQRSQQRLCSPSLFLSVSLSLCVRAWTIENDRDTVKNTKEHTHTHVKTTLTLLY